MFSTPVRINGNRTRPVDWKTVRRILRYRQERRNLKRDGWHAADPTDGQGFELFDAVRQMGRKMVDMKINTDGTMLYVKLEP